MTAEIHEIHLPNGLTRLPLDADKVLNEASGKLKMVVIVGYDEQDGFYFASSISDGPEVLWALEQAKRQLLEISQ